MDRQYDTRFIAPMTMQIVGSSGSGKSFFTKRLLDHAHEMIHPPPDRILYCYSEYQSLFDEMPNVEFHRGLSEELIKRENLSGHTCLVIDDLADEVDEKLLERLFTKLSHHRFISVIFIVHSLFYPGLKNMRLISLNTNYLVIFKTARDQNSIAIVARQMFGKSYKYMILAYEDATSKRHGYLLVDSKDHSSGLIRLRTQIFPGELTICYVPKQHHGAA